MVGATDDGGADVVVVVVDDEVDDTGFAEDVPIQYKGHLALLS